MEQYVKGFQRFQAGEDVRPVTSCKFLQHTYFSHTFYFLHFLIHFMPFYCAYLLLINRIYIFGTHR